MPFYNRNLDLINWLFQIQIPWTHPNTVIYNPFYYIRHNNFQAHPNTSKMYITRLFDLLNMDGIRCLQSVRNFLTGFAGRCCYINTRELVLWKVYEHFKACWWRSYSVQDAIFLVCCFVRKHLFPLFFFTSSIGSKIQFFFTSSIGSQIQFFFCV